MRRGDSEVVRVAVEINIELLKEREEYDIKIVGVNKGEVEDRALWWCRTMGWSTPVGREGEEEDRGGIFPSKKGGP
ncbi:unnamed protein product [Macrosiphum euphorbiae]|uniref:Uncharacterized protein n=1 Tax=Macrosiphum euphorbiae TaxID=13131 RepID=A0AAV0W0W4_9HEMI|nr:unnamed protein product [Macrosiphum euphorbiae]